MFAVSVQCTSGYIAIIITYAPIAITPRVNLWLEKKIKIVKLRALWDEIDEYFHDERDGGPLPQPKQTKQDTNDFNYNDAQVNRLCGADSPSPNSRTYSYESFKRHTSIVEKVFVPLNHTLLKENHNR